MLQAQQGIPPAADIVPGAMATELELGAFVRPDGHVPVGQVAYFGIQATQQVLSAQV